MKPRSAPELHVSFHFSLMPNLPFSNLAGPQMTAEVVYIGHPMNAWCWAHFIFGVLLMAIGWIKAPSLESSVLTSFGLISWLVALVLFSRRNFLHLGRKAFFRSYLWLPIFNRYFDFSSFNKLCRSAVLFGETDHDFLIKVMAIPSSPTSPPLVLSVFNSYGIDPDTHAESQALLQAISQTTGIQVEAEINVGV